MRRIFIGANGLRAGWRFAIFIGCTWILVQGAGWVITHPLGYEYNERAWVPSDFIFDGGLSFGAAVLVAWIMGRFERRSLADYGVPARSAFGALFWEGVLWGLANSALVIAILLAVGAASLHGFALSGAAFAHWAVVWFLAFLFVGLTEEFIYRGYSLVTLASGMGFWAAAVLLSAVFGVSHIFKPQESVLDIFNIIAFGLFWCLTFKRTGSLWFAIGFHAMSDYADMVIFAEPNTGNNGQPLTGHLLNVDLHGPAWLTGGICGTEASVVALGVLVATWLVFLRRFPGHRRKTPQGA